MARRSGERPNRWSAAANVTLYEIPTNDVWAHDHGPMFLAGPPGLPLAVVDWEYNAWGGKYPPFDLDNDVPRRVAELTGRRRFLPGIILEGGAVDGDGARHAADDRGVPAQPESQSAARPLTGRAISGRLVRPAKSSGWAGGIVGDDTDGHIDELARFVGPRTVVCAVEPDPRDENYEPLADNFARLAAATDAQGHALGWCRSNSPARCFTTASGCRPVT